MFRLVSLNLNGIRSAATKGLLPWANPVADCMGVQEIKAQAADIAERFDNVPRHDGLFPLAEREGLLGCGVYTRKTQATWWWASLAESTRRALHRDALETPSASLSIISCYSERLQRRRTPARQFAFSR